MESREGIQLPSVGGPPLRSLLWGANHLSKWMKDCMAARGNLQSHFAQFPDHAYCDMSSGIVQMENGAKFMRRTSRSSF
jgi:hypothetical protein